MRYGYFLSSPDSEDSTQRGRRESTRPRLCLPPPNPRTPFLTNTYWPPGHVRARVSTSVHKYYKGRMNFIPRARRIPSLAPARGGWGAPAGGVRALFHFFGTRLFHHSGEMVRLTRRTLPPFESLKSWLSFGTLRFRLVRLLHLERGVFPGRPRFSGVRNFGTLLSSSPWDYRVPKGLFRSARPRSTLGPEGFS